MAQNFLVLNHFVQLCMYKRTKRNCCAIIWTIGTTAKVLPLYFLCVESVNYDSKLLRWRTCRRSPYTGSEHCKVSVKHLLVLQCMSFHLNLFEMWSRFPLHSPHSLHSCLGVLDYRAQRNWNGAGRESGKGTRSRPKGIIYTCCLTASVRLSSKTHQRWMAAGCSSCDLITRNVASWEVQHIPDKFILGKNACSMSAYPPPSYYSSHHLFHKALPKNTWNNVCEVASAAQALSCSEASVKVSVMNMRQWAYSPTKTNKSSYVPKLWPWMDVQLILVITQKSFKTFFKTIKNVLCSFLSRFQM